MKYLVAIALIVGLFIWFTHRSATPHGEHGEKPAVAAATPVAQKGSSPAPSRSPSALRAPIVRTQQVLEKVKEYQKEAD